MAITTVLTLNQLYIDYKSSVKEIHKNLDLIKHTFLESISIAVWNYDTDSLEAHMDGLMKLSDIVYLEINTLENGVFIRGKKSADDVIIDTIKIKHASKNEIIELGSLTVYFSLKGVYQKLLSKTVYILVAQGLKTLLVSFFIFYLFYSLVGRYLSIVSRYAQHLNDENLFDELTLDKSESTEDEIDTLVSSLNQMRLNFIETRTQKEKTVEALNHQATHDTLTGLPNRVLLHDRASHLIDQAEREKKKIAFLFLDLDGFKKVNDIHGHSIGDEVLIYVSHLLQQNIRKSDTLARLGGDEFVAVIYFDHDINVINHLSKKIIEELNKPFEIKDISIKVTVSIGVSVFPDDATTAELLLRNADTAMFKSKQMGKNRLQFYLPEFTQKAELRIQLERELDMAIENDDISVYYQPQIGLDGGLVGIESLVRWNHPTKGFISPSEFIPIAEDSGQIIALSDLIFTKVFKFLQDIERKGLPKSFKTISINVSPKHFSQENFYLNIKNSVQLFEVDVSRIMMEITEGLILNDIDEAIVKMNALQTMGIKFSIDDFGTGYSSLSYLQKLPLNELKIDQSFVQAMLLDKGSATIIEMIITMAEKLGFTLMAEGVETQEQKDFLKSLGCFNYQGYFFDKPLSEAEFVKRYL